MTVHRLPDPRPDASVPAAERLRAGLYAVADALCELLAEPSTTRATAAPADEYLTAEEIGQLLRAEPSWVYRHRAALGGVKLDGILRFPRRRFEAYLARQARLGDA